MNMIQFNRKAPLFQSSMIREMTIFANQTGAINLAQGFPEFAPPSELLEALERVAKSGDHQYSENHGVLETREALAKTRTRGFGFEVSVDEILVTCGSTEAMTATYLALFDPGDKIGVFDPFYGSYLANAVLTGCEVLLAPLTGENFQIDQEKLEQVFRSGIKAFVLCNPSNPTGKVFSHEELSLIAELARKYNTVIITDEVYEHMVYHPKEHISFARLPGMYDRTITISSLSKTFSITGWRLGFLTAPKYVIDNIRKFHDLLTVCAPTPLQTAAITALQFGNAYYEKLLSLYEQKKERFLGGLKQLGLPHSRPEGTYYTLVDFGEFTKSSLHSCDSNLEFARAFAKTYGIAGVPMSCFSRQTTGKHILRFHFAKEDATLDQVLEQL